MRWPEVLDEDATLDAVLAGKSLARFGDGELKLCRGRDCISQVWTAPLQKELKNILITPRPNLAVATLRARCDTPKAWFWDKLWNKTASYVPLHSKYMTYYSHWITRPDSAPWIDRADYWEKMVSLWKDKEVVLVAGSQRSLTPAILRDAASVCEIHTMYRDAYRMIDQIEHACLARPEKIFLLCCGATATCLAARLSDAGRQALDLGHIGMFWKKHYRQFFPESGDTHEAS